MISLPIDAVLDELCARIAEYGAVVLRAPTGAGKTTRVPPALLAGLEGQVLVVEPRRVAARSAAAWVAQEQNWALGKEVGYRIRFEDRTSKGTRVLFVTEGILLAWLQRDPFLEGVGAIVFDEFHERSLASDLGLSMVERVRRTVREDLSLVVMSATLESERVSSFLDGCPIVESEGRLHPVHTELLARPDERRLEVRAEAAVLRMLERCDRGDLLVFLPGLGEIERLAERLEPRLGSLGIEIHQLFGDLPIERQQAALLRSPKGSRRIVLSTNVAETSVTVDGVTAVIDSGLERRVEVDPATGFDRLELRPISRSAARQRAGRAGRQEPGHCLRLWTASEESQRLESTPPEVGRVDLAGPLLRLIAWGEADPMAFPWFEAPHAGRAAAAFDLLERLEAVVPSGTGWHTTPHGDAMARIGCHPRLARLLVECASLGLSSRGALLTALLEERDVFKRAERGWQAQACRSDLLERLHAVEAWARGQSASKRLVASRARRVLDAASVLERGVSALDSAPCAGAWTPEEETEQLLRALLAAYPDRLARRRDARASSRSGTSATGAFGDAHSDRAVLVGGRGVRLAASSGVRQADLFLAIDVGRASAAVGEGQAGAPREALVFLASAVEEDWLDPAQVRSERVVEWDEERDRALASIRRTYLGLLLDQKEVPVTSLEASSALAALALDQPQRFLDLDSEPAEQVLARLASLALWRPELEVPDPHSLFAQLIPQLCVGCRSAVDLKKQLVAPALEGLLEWPLRRALESLAPSSIELSNGRRGRLHYPRDGGPPVLAMRIQELFGVEQTPSVDDGRHRVVLHLLAPNQRPQQVTTDLAGFWKGSYAMVRKELAGRYPKHSWPDDPATASPPQRRGSRGRRR